MSTVNVGVDIALKSVQRLMISKENLALVTSVVKIKALDSTWLLVEYDPKWGRQYKVLDLLDKDEGIKEVSDAGVRTIVRLLEVVTGESFIIITDNDKELHFRRKDFHQKALAFENRQ